MYKIIFQTSNYLYILLKGFIEPPISYEALTWTEVHNNTN